MTRRNTTIVFVALLVAVLGLAYGVQAQVPAPTPPTQFGTVGPVTAPHGFPLSYSDGAGTTLVLCIDQADPNCITTPPEVVGTFAPGFGDEGFWWMATADAPPLVGGGKALLVLALEAAYGGDGSVSNGNQMSFGRIRIRVDVPSDGDYTVTHPYGTKTFTGVTVADGINYTEDIGAFDPILGEIVPPSTPPTSTSAQRAANNFMGAQASPILESFLIWDTGAPAGYVGDPAVPHTVTGSPTGNNLFRVAKVGDLAVSTETSDFLVMGKLLSTETASPHTYPDVLPKKLQNLGPLYRPGTAPGYPVGYPTFYEDSSAVQLTYCPAIDPMCISAPVDPANLASVALNTGDEGFFWTASALVDTGTLPGGRAGRGLLVLALEGAFGGDGSVIDGNQMVFGRIRIRIDTPRAGTYTVTHPYGVNTFVVTAADQAATGGRRSINYTEDIGGFNPFQYLAAFQAEEPSQMFDRGLYSKIGPQFLTWPGFASDPTLLRPHISDPQLNVRYIGDPLVDHVVTGSPFGTNFFRIQGPLVNVQTDLFSVSGKVYDPATFEVPPNANAPVAVDDAIATDQNVAVSIPILANDHLPNAAPPITTFDAITLGNPEVTGPADGTAVVSGSQILYTPNLNFSGTDTFTYTVTVGGIPSNVATVTVTVNSVEALTLTRALVNTRGRLAVVQARGPAWTISGRTTVPNAVISIHAGTDLTGPLIATVTANRRGAWSVNRRVPGFIPSPGTTPIFISSSGGATLGANATVR